LDPKVVITSSVRAPIIDVRCRQNRSKPFICFFHIGITSDVMYQLQGIQVIPVIFDAAVRVISCLNLCNEILPSPLEIGSRAAKRAQDTLYSSNIL
jgi:hypothetical protein